MFLKSSIKQFPDYNTFMPEYFRHEIIPDILNISHSELKALFAIDLKLVLELLGIYDKDLFIKILRNQIKISKELGKALIKYHGKLREYSDELQEHLSSLINNYGHTIIGTNDSIDEVIKGLQKLDRFPIYDLEIKINNQVYIKSATHLTTPINYWFPEVYSTKVSNPTSVMETIKDKDKFYNAIFRMVVLDSFKQGKINSEALISTWLITKLKIVNGNQIAYNFPVIVAKWIYTKALGQDKFANDKVLYVGDLSMGWGGRLVGLVSSMSIESPLAFRKVRLIGTDVNTTITKRYKRINNFYRKFISPEIDFKMYNSTTPAERIFDDTMFLKGKGRLHFIFTSPPYFNKEKYSEDANQSYIQYSNYENWREGFLRPMLTNAYELLRNGGECWINIADIKEGKKIYPLEKDTVDIAKEIGFKHNDTYFMLMGIVPGTKKKGNISNSQKEVFINGSLQKYEPIFLFEK
ncbi:MAG: DNA methyltransferase [FCB group bacterium]|jgi:hypothetical protein